MSKNILERNENKQTNKRKYVCLEKAKIRSLKF